MLEQLSKEDKKWRRLALCICNDKELSEDLTNDMYIKVYESGKKYEDIHDGYIYRVIKNLYLHYLRKQKKEKTITFTDFFKITDQELQIVDITNEKLELRLLMNEALKEIDFFDREILLHTSERSLRKNEEYLGIKVGTLFYSRKIALKKLEETDKIKNHKK